MKSLCSLNMNSTKLSADTYEDLKVSPPCWVSPSLPDHPLPFWLLSPQLLATLREASPAQGLVHRKQIKMGRDEGRVTKEANQGSVWHGETKEHPFQEEATDVESEG